MCKCPDTDKIRCLAKSQKITYPFAECMGGCSCPCHSRPIDGCEEKDRSHRKTARIEEEKLSPLPAPVQFADMPHMRQCPSCKMRFAGPEHSQHKRTDKAKRKAS